MENEYLLFSPALLKTEVFHLAGIPCQKKEKPKYLSSYQSVWTIIDKCASLQCCTEHAVRNKTGTSAAPQTVGCQHRELHLLEIQTLFSLFSPNTMDTRGGSYRKLSLTCWIVTECVGWLCFYFCVHGFLPLCVSGSNSPLPQGTGQNPLHCRYCMYDTNTHSGLVTKPWHGQMALQFKDHISSWEGKDKHLLVEEVSPFTGCCPSWKGSSPEHKWLLNKHNFKNHMSLKWFKGGHVLLLIRDILVCNSRVLSGQNCSSPSTVNVISVCWTHRSQWKPPYRKSSSTWWWDRNHSKQ